MHEHEETPASAASCGCYQVQALITVDERGQIVLPKHVRDRADIKARDKLALTTIEKDGTICCILLTKAEELVQVVQSTLGSVIHGTTKEEGERDA